MFKVLIIIVALTLISCKATEWVVPQPYCGYWRTENTKVTVRFKVGDEKHSQFISDSAILTLVINHDKTASGTIGLSSFENGKMLKNHTLWETGVSYVIECGVIGKIFKNDPLETKEVDIWLGQVNENGTIKATMRLGDSVFPMADVMFERVKD